jgi:hypothetical protein
VLPFPLGLLCAETGATQTLTRNSKYSVEQDLLELVRPIFLGADPVEALLGPSS